MARIAVLGGTKFFGAKLAEQLADDGHEVTVISRTQNLPSALQNKVAQVKINTETQNGESTPQRITRIASVISEQSFDVIVDNISWLENDVDTHTAALKRTQFKKYILCSTVAVYNQWNRDIPQSEIHAHTLKEEQADLSQPDFSPKISNDALTDFYSMYCNGKRHAELELNAFAKNNLNIKTVILRPAIIEGVSDPYNRTWYWVQRLLDGGPIIIPKTHPKTLYKNVFVDDVVTAFHTAITQDHEISGAINVAGEDILSVKEYILLLASGLGIQTKDIKICEAELADITNKIPAFEFPAFFAGTGFIADIEKAKANLGFQPTPTTKWLPDIAMKLSLLAKNGLLADSLGYEKRQSELEYYS